MTPLDLTVRPPRGPRALLGGFPMLARTIDRARASLPGGNLGRYISISRGLSATMLAELEIAPDDFVAAVAAAENDDGVLAWLEQRAPRAKIAAAAERVTASRLSEIPAAHRPFVESLYPADLFATCETSFELLERDDSRMWGELVAPASA